MTISSMRGLCVAIAVTLGLTLAQECRAGQVYLALGDSLTYGLDPSTPASLIPSYADQGFVNPFANSLAALNGGIRPTVLNLGIWSEIIDEFPHRARSAGLYDIPPGQPQLFRPAPLAECPDDLVDQRHPRRGQFGRLCELRDRLK